MVLQNMGIGWIGGLSRPDPNDPSDPSDPILSHCHLVINALHPILVCAQHLPVVSLGFTFLGVYPGFPKTIATGNTDPKDQVPEEVASSGNTTSARSVHVM